MSWNKNTVKDFHIETIIGVLATLEVPYVIIVLGKVRGLGLNDFDDKYYEIRKLMYSDVVILEQMHRTTDCDSDDRIVSYQFTKDEVPKNWKIEITYDSETGKIIKEPKGGN